MELKRIQYNTMNSWNNSTAPAYNLKIYNVIPKELQSKVYELLEADEFYNDINSMIRDFDETFDYEWQAGFNGRSGGYLVLYIGGRNDDFSVYTQPGRSITESEVPDEVLKAFEALATEIVADTIYKAENCKVIDEEYTVKKTKKVLQWSE